MFCHLFLLTLMLLNTSGEETGPEKYDLSQVAFVVLSQSHPRHAAIGDETKANLVTIQRNLQTSKLVNQYELRLTPLFLKLFQAADHKSRVYFSQTKKLCWGPS